MHPPHIEGVVPVHLFPEDNGSIAHGSGKYSEQHGTLRVNITRCRCDCGQSGHRPDTETHHRRFPLDDPVERHPGHRCERGADLGVEESEASDTARGECAPGIEAEPAEPQQRRPQGDKRDVMGLGIMDLASAHDEHGGERRQAGQLVHDDATGEIEHTPICQPAPSPDHMDKGEVDEQQPPHQEDQVGLERHPIGERPGDQGGE